MNHSKTERNQQGTSPAKWLLAILSGLMLSASFAPVSIGWLAWFALVPLLKSLENQPPVRGFYLGLVAGLSHYLTLIYWIIAVLNRYGDLNLFLSFGALFLLAFYLSLYPGVFAFLFSRIQETTLSIFLAAGLWVSLEYIRAWILTGFPWCLLGYTQYDYLRIIQLADLVGVYGVSFLIVLFNSLIYLLVFKRKTVNSRFFVGEATVALVLGILTMVYGSFRLPGQPAGSGPHPALKTVLIQANIDQSLKWDPAYQKETIKTYEKLSREASGFEPDLMVWPETATPFFFQDHGPLSRRVVSLVQELDTPLLFGSPAYRTKGAHTKLYNRAYLLVPGEEKPRSYDKVHLVPFGEYVPLKRFLPFLNSLVPAAGDFQPGEQITPLDLNGVEVGVLICFEAIFPELARIHTSKGARILANLTNDAWFGRTSAPYQHLSMAAFRAVENRRPMIRAANTGISAFISPWGKITSRTGLFQEAILKGQVNTQNTSLTFYVRWGYLFPLLVSVSALIALAFVFFKRRRVKSMG